MNILVVDDNKFMREMISKIVSDQTHHTLLADGHAQAIAHLNNHDIDLVLMDIEMPEVNGFELTKMIRESNDEWIPIIFLSANDSEKYLEQGIDAGGDDYLTKPVKEVILKAKIRAMERIVNMKHELDLANKELEKLSHIDDLTQLINRRELDKQLTINWQNNQRLSADMSILMIDIDYFKQYNDHYGHLAGDDCLVQVAKIISSCFIRQSDVIARYGGEEFVVLLPFTPIDGARFKVKGLLKSLTKAAITHEFSPVAEYVTLSVGISASGLGAKSVQALLEQADKALYQAKEKGRNQLQCFGHANLSEKF